VAVLSDVDCRLLQEGSPACQPYQVEVLEEQERLNCDRSVLTGPWLLFMILVSPAYLSGALLVACVLLESWPAVSDAAES